MSRRRSNRQTVKIVNKLKLFDRTEQILLREMAFMDFEDSIFKIIIDYVLENVDHHGLKSCEHCPKQIVGYVPYYINIIRDPTYTKKQVFSQLEHIFQVYPLEDYLTLGDYFSISKINYNFFSFINKRKILRFDTYKNGKWIRFPIFRNYKICPKYKCRNLKDRLLDEQDENDIFYNRVKEHRRQMIEEEKKEKKKELEDNFYEYFYN